MLTTFNLSIFLLIFLSPPYMISCARVARTRQDLVHSSCSHARYPTLCVQTLSSHAGPATTPLGLAQAAVNVSLAHAGTLAAYLNTQQLRAPSLGYSKRQRVAVSDCAAQMSDSVDELSKTLSELQHLRATTSFEWHMSNALTWTSAALTNGQSCLNGFQDGGDVDGKLKLDVSRRVTDVAMLTSNALYLISRVGDSRSRKKNS